MKTFTASVLSRFVNTAKTEGSHRDFICNYVMKKIELVRTEAYDAIGCYCEKRRGKKYLKKTVLSEKEWVGKKLCN